MVSSQQPCRIRRASSREDSNLRHPRCERGALPAELRDVVLPSVRPAGLEPTLPSTSGSCLLPVGLRTRVACAWRDSNPRCVQLRQRASLPGDKVPQPLSFWLVGPDPVLPQSQLNAPPPLMRRSVLPELQTLAVRALGRARTGDSLIKSQVLYQLSYQGLLCSGTGGIRIPVTRATSERTRPLYDGPRAPGRARTGDQLIKSQQLYQLSYGRLLCVPRAGFEPALPRV